MHYIDKLITNCQQAKSAKPVRTFSFTDLSALDDIKTAIYIIKEINADEHKTFQALKEFKSTSERACPKLNAPSSTLYVGSSTTGLRKRIEQHLGDGPKGTYALHLKHWFTGEKEISILEYSKPREVVQIIEDALSHQLAPAFGKRGGNNS